MPTALTNFQPWTGDPIDLMPAWTHLSRYVTANLRPGANPADPWHDIPAAKEQGLVPPPELILQGNRTPTRRWEPVVHPNPDYGLRFAFWALKGGSSYRPQVLNAYNHQPFIWRGNWSPTALMAEQGVTTFAVFEEIGGPPIGDAAAWTVQPWGSVAADQPVQILTGQFFEVLGNSAATDKVNNVDRFVITENGQVAVRAEADVRFDPARVWRFSHWELSGGQQLLSSTDLEQVFAEKTSGVARAFYVLVEDSFDVPREGPTGEFEWGPYFSGRRRARTQAQREFDLAEALARLAPHLSADLRREVAAIARKQASIAAASVVGGAPPTQVSKPRVPSEERKMPKRKRR